MSSNQIFETPQEALAHYGVKGMKWGVRKSSKSGGSRSSRFTPKQRRIAKAGVASLVAAGSIAAAVAISRNSSVPVSSLPNMGVPNVLTITNAHGTSTYGSYALEGFRKAGILP